jgi:hypothetical protein
MSGSVQEILESRSMIFLFYITLVNVTNPKQQQIKSGPGPFHHTFQPNTTLGIINHNMLCFSTPYRFKTDYYSDTKASTANLAARLLQTS